MATAGIPGRAAPGLVLGPLLRHVAETEATIWVESDRLARSKVLGYKARTFEVNGHRYGLVVPDDLRPGTGYGYRGALDGTLRWPEPDSEPVTVLGGDIHHSYLAQLCDADLS